MRALGPGSVSSLLKLVLDVIYFVLLACVAGLLVGAMLALLLPTDLGVWSWFSTRGPKLAGGLMAIGASAALLLFIIERVRRIFATLIVGDPFHPSNVVRLRAIGFSLAALELTSYATRLIAGWAFAERERSEHFPFNPTVWFAVLVVFVLAEVFREGARLRSEAELTI
jgi:hypothetical protein